MITTRARFRYNIKRNQRNLVFVFLCSSLLPTPMRGIILELKIKHIFSQFCRLPTLVLANTRHAKIEVGCINDKISYLEKLELCFQTRTLTANDWNQEYRIISTNISDIITENADTSDFWGGYFRQKIGKVLIRRCQTAFQDSHFYALSTVKPIFS